MVTWVDNNVDQEVKKTTDDVFTCDDTGEIIINDEVVSFINFFIYFE